MKKLTTETFIKNAKLVHGELYSYTKVHYTGNKKLVIITCMIHGDFQQTPGSHINQSAGCPKCSGCVRLTNEEFIAKAKLRHGDVYDYTKTRYINAFGKVIVICRFHGEFEQEAHSHSSGKGCPTCLQSKGEKEISKIIEQIGLIYKSQYRIYACRNKNTLPFDFFIPSHNLLIEYQGDIHFKIIEGWGGEVAFQQRQLHDKIKREFAITNGYNFLEITYKDFNNIETILKSVLSL